MKVDKEYFWWILLGCFFGYLAYSAHLSHRSFMECIKTNSATDCKEARK